MPSCQTTRLVQVMIWSRSTWSSSWRAGFPGRDFGDRPFIGAGERLAEDAVEIIHQRLGDAGMERLEGVPGTRLALPARQAQSAGLDALPQLCRFELGQEGAHRRLHRGDAGQLVQANVA